jgi:hypothetical protein
VGEELFIERVAAGSHRKIVAPAFIAGYARRRALLGSDQATTT